ncbi:NAD(P)H-dependent oxidoreductase [Marinagarivorans algicola]|uniref:NAD(P)H-dependent oxidoreductase n=1 Tax=Marinagarivorans algicola TaxID=1513270 RepID=UPI0006B9E965|nr:NAD(P)H-dependent oxidoreductase [Marinagarivorans algicola]
MSKIQRVLILFAHPSIHTSEVNKPLFEAASHQKNVTLVDLYQEYPTYNINIEKEQQRLRDHDVVMFMFPLYWYSTPSILKEWQDLVLEYGFAYGSGGTALKDKRFICALTAGGAEQAYRAEGFNHFTIRELLQPLEQMASLTGMQYLPPFTVFSARTAVEENRLSEHIRCWQVLLQALVNNDVNPKALAKHNTINGFICELKEAQQ